MPPSLLSYRNLGYAILFLFLCNLILIKWIVDWSLITPKDDRRINSEESIDESGTVTGSPSCNPSGQLLTSALSRMQTEECRTMARHLVCNINRITPDSLPNSCPKYDDTLRGHYVGCFEDSSESRVLSGHLYNVENKDSPVDCVNMCLRAGYKFAGVADHSECSCGDILAGAVLLPATSCEKYRCDNESPSFGRHNATAVYRTGLIEKTVSVVNYVEPDGKEQNLRILFLLQLNGRNSRQINRLLRIIYSPKHYYIIHVDSRQQFLFEEMKQLVATIRNAGFENVYLMEKRFATIWGGFSLLAMIFAAVKTALYQLKWTSWDFMSNLSESDFPILSMAELEFHLARNKGRIFLNSHGYDTARFIRKQGLEYVFMQCEDRMWRLRKRTKFPNSLRLDGGSDWIVISRDFAEFAISDEELPRSFRQFFANVLLPVESFFHTLSANSKFCMQTAKGNLHLTNWKRPQGCRCAALRKIIDWCGCSPLVLRSTDISKFAVEIAQNKSVFFGRKFDPVISQQAIATAEAQALRFTDGIIDDNHPSFNKSWINIYFSQLEKSVLLESFARALLQYRRSPSCSFQNLLSIVAYKENDEARIQNIYELSYLCNDATSEVIQILVESCNPVKFVNRIVDGYELQDLEIGADFNPKEEIFQNYHGVLSEEDTIYAKLQWRRIELLPTSVPQNFTSPQVVAEWKNSRDVLVKRATVKSYASLFGGQYTELFPNETSPDEWTVEFIHTENNVNTIVGSIKFVIFSTSARNIDDTVISKYFRRIDVCSEGNTTHLRMCLTTPWSMSFPDPKSRLLI